MEEDEDTELQSSSEGLPISPLCSSGYLDSPPGPRIGASESITIRANPAIGASVAIEANSRRKRLSPSIGDSIDGDDDPDIQVQDCL